MLGGAIIAADDLFPAAVGNDTQAKRSRPPRTRSEAPNRCPVVTSDSLLVSRAQRGDRAAFNRLIERHQQRVFQTALNVVRNPEDAEDIVQETFLRVYQSLSTFKGEAAFSTWTHRIAVNLAIDSVRRTGKGECVQVDETTITDEREQYDPFAITGSNPQRRMLRRELCHAIQKALASLGEQHRSILELREVENLSYEDLASRLHIPKGTVMSRLYHARQKLLAALRPYVEADAMLDAVCPRYRHAAPAAR